MRLANTIRAHRGVERYGDGVERDLQLDQLYAMAEAGDRDVEQYIQMLLDGQEPSAQFFGGAGPSQ